MEQDETAKICRFCLSADDTWMEVLTRKEPGQYKVQKVFDLTGLQIESSTGVPSYLCTMCEARLKKMYLFRWRCNRNNDLVDKFIEHHNTVKNESEITQEDHDHSAEHAVGTKLSIKTEVTAPDTAKDLHLNRKCYAVHEAGKTYGCCGTFADDLFEAEDNPISIKSEHEEIDDQHQLQATDDVLNHQQDKQNTNPLESICQDQKDRPIIVANNTCAVDSAAESTQNVLSPRTRNDHSKSHSKNHKHRCRHCSVTYPVLNKLKMHIRSHTKQDNLKRNRRDRSVTVANNSCAVDSAAESTQNALSPRTRNDHSKSHSKNHKHRCPHCSATYPVLNKLNIHIRSHTKQDNLKRNRRDHPVTVANNSCDVDSAAESTQNALSPRIRNDHSKSHSKNHKHRCPHCSATYQFLSRLKVHIRTHTGERPYQCKVCDKSFISKDHLAHHSKIHNKDQQHQCPHCCSKFRLLSSLEVHIRTHTGEKPYQCKICNKAFRSSSVLTQHSKIHNKDQHRKCPHCSSKFANSSNLLDHIRTHTGEKPYKCKVCDKSFSSLANLAHHKKIHNKDQQLQCPHCSSKYTWLASLKVHIRTHTGERPYQCKICGKAFRTSSNLSDHSKTHKKNEPH